MYICVCNAVTERQIQDAVKNGATRMRDLRNDLGVTTECCRCATCARECLNTALQNKTASEPWIGPEPCTLTLEEAV